MKAMLGKYFPDILSMGEAGLQIEIEETGSTFAENAYIKACAVCEKTGKPALADDSGLRVDFLCGEPGIYSARYAGVEQNDAKNIEKLLEKMKGVPQEARTADFTTTLCLCFPDGRVLYTEGNTSGRILTEKRGENGFGYDPVFFSFDLQKSFAEATESEKNAVSHRGRALQKMVSLLEE